MSKLTLPGLIDPHVHLRDPNQTHKEDFYTGTAAALAGGYTTIIDMPNNQNPITSKEALVTKIASARQKVVCDIGFYFGSLGDNLSEFDKVKNTVLGLKLYLNKTTGNFLVDTKNLSRLFSTFPKNLPILVHVEEDVIETVLQVVSQTQHKTHICHITAAELTQIIKAKEQGLPVTCGVTPHHLFLTEDDAQTLGPYGLVKPKLRSKKDVLFLWEHLNFIDVIESDHAPHTKEEKEGKEPPYGLPGLETTLPLLLTAALEKRLTIEDIIRLCHTNPSKIFGIPADTKTFVEADTDISYVIENKNLLTKCGWSPFNGWSVKGKVSRVVLHDREVYKNGTILAPCGSGKIITS